MQRFPWVTVLSCGEVTFKISLSCTCRVRLQPTPQYEHVVVALVCPGSSYAPEARRSHSRLRIKPPVGHTSMRLPQQSSPASRSGGANSMHTRAFTPPP